MFEVASQAVQRHLQIVLNGMVQQLANHLGQTIPDGRVFARLGKPGFCYILHSSTVTTDPRLFKRKIRPFQALTTCIASGSQDTGRFSE